MIIHHVTLQTGHVARQRRRDVGEAVIAAVSEALDSLLTGGRPAVPGQPDYWLSGVHDRDTLIVTLWTGPRDADRGDRDDGPTPIITSATCLSEAASAETWRLLHEIGALPGATDPARPPPVPWTADRLEAGYVPMALEAMASGEASLWTGDLCRCLAWAWVAYVRESGGGA